jgi:hypothetical protein
MENNFRIGAANVFTTVVGEWVGFDGEYLDLYFRIGAADVFTAVVGEWVGFDGEGLTGQSHGTAVTGSGQETHGVERHLQLRTGPDEHGADRFGGVRPLETVLHHRTFL